MNIDQIMAFENGELDQEEAHALIQSGIDSGMIWHLQGSYQRLAQAYIDAGVCTGSY